MPIVGDGRMRTSTTSTTEADQAVGPNEPQWYMRYSSSSHPVTVPPAWSVPTAAM